MTDHGLNVNASRSPAARTRWRPVAYVAVLDVARRRRISEALRGDGWVVIDLPSGYHLVEDIADVLLGEHACLRPPDLVVVDAASPGCSGITIARGMRDLGWSVPVVLLRSAEPRDPLDPRPVDGALAILSPDASLDDLLDVARRQRSPLAGPRSIGDGAPAKAGASSAA
jgi:CheY-like chemotaxis protein